MRNILRTRAIFFILLMQVVIWTNLIAQEFNVLPDGTKFQFWSDSTRYSKVYHVAQKNQRASDENPGTPEKPFKSINAAALILQPGEKVIVHEGIYRECIRPERGGTSANKMIFFESAPGERVIIKGSEIWKPEVKQSSGWNSRNTEEGISIWMADIPKDFFKAYNPFLVRNAYHYLTTYGVVTDKEWMQRAMLFRGMIFVDGKPLKQVYEYRNLNKTPNGFWVEDPGLRIHFTLNNNEDPSKHLIEITTREQIFAPFETGLGYLHIKGFIFEQASDGLPVPQRAIVSTMRGHHWIIENNKIEWANACGLDIGAQSWDSSLPELFGYHIIKNNIIRNCGICGIAGAYAVEQTLIEGNIIEKIGFHDLERMWECMGIKFHSCKNSLIRNNIFRDLTHAGGVWLDCSNSNCRITNNVFANIQSLTGACYSEMNYDLNIIDHNIFWDIRVDQSAKLSENTFTIYGPAVRADCNEKLLVLNNFFGKIENHAISFNLNQSDRRHEGRTGLCYSNVAVNNLFYQCPNRILLARLLVNTIDGNTYDISNDSFSFILQYPSPLSYQNLDGWQKYLGLDSHSTQAKIEASFDIETCTLKLKIEGRLPENQKIESVNVKAATNNPGPFLTKLIQTNQETYSIEQKFPIITY